MASFTMEDYQKAYKLGKKDYQARICLLYTSDAADE